MTWAEFAAVILFVAFAAYLAWDESRKVKP